jgi:hypothetical protein
VLLCASLAAGCGHGRVAINSNGGVPVAAPPAGTSVSGGSVSVNIARGSDASTLLGLGLLIGIAYGTEHQQRFVPVMDPARVVHEQDCSKPIETPTANLRCR